MHFKTLFIILAILISSCTQQNKKKETSTTILNNWRVEICNDSFSSDINFLERRSTLSSAITSESINTMTAHNLNCNTDGTFTIKNANQNISFSTWGITILTEENREKSINIYLNGEFASTYSKLSSLLGNPKVSTDLDSYYWEDSSNKLSLFRPENYNGVTFITVIKRD